jgi:hypothetical protein
MRKIVRSAVAAGAVGLVALLGLVAATPAPVGKAVDIYLLYLGGVALLGLVAATSAAAGTERTSEFESALVRPPNRSSRPRELERIEREVDLGQASAFYLHYRLRATLREIAAHRLRTHRGLDLDRQSQESCEALGEPAWELLRPDREPPRFHDARGVPFADLRTVVETLEDV